VCTTCLSARPPRISRLQGNSSWDPIAIKGNWRIRWKGGSSQVAGPSWSGLRAKARATGAILWNKCHRSASQITSSGALDPETELSTDITQQNNETHEAIQSSGYRRSDRRLNNWFARRPSLCRQHRGPRRRLEPDSGRSRKREAFV
jgi:hypothetical protein